MAETVIIKVTATDTDGATGEGTSTLTVQAPAPPTALVPIITSFTTDDTTLDPGQSTKFEVQGNNYTRVIWRVVGVGGTFDFDPDATGEDEKRQFTAPATVLAGTEYTRTKHTQHLSLIHI